MRTVIIYLNKLDKLNNFKKIHNLNNSKNVIYYNQKTIYDLYDARFINPPFFDRIIVIRQDLSQEALQMIYNMTNVDGTILLPSKYLITDKVFNNSQETNNIKYRGISHPNNTLKNFSLIKKSSNFVYQFPKGRVVDFIIMGAQKAGTTALSLNISKHPDIYIDNNKDPAKSEVHYFDINFKKGLEWYKHHFNYSKKIVGEKTPELMYLDWTFPLIQSVNPYVKMIVILRNPIIRAYSAWKHAKKMFNETRSFEEAIYAPNSTNKTFYTSQFHYLERGLYYRQLTELLKWFSKDNLLILINENVIKNMNEEYNRVYAFLNLPSFDTTYNLEYVSDNKSTISPTLYKKLVKYYKKDVENLEKHFRIKTHWFE
jgi:hypothetical protein